MNRVCNLCRINKDLQRKSHIIPEFFYNESNLFHEHHNLKAYDLRKYLETGEIKLILKNQKSGFYDQYILCKECDGVILNKYETYGREFFYSEDLSNEHRLLLRRTPKYIECLNADYKLLKLLFLSILWRSDISKQPIFSEISIDDVRRETLRTMLLSSDPASENEFPIFIFHTLLDNQISKDHFFHPFKSRFGNNDGFTFFFGGFILVYAYGIKGLPENLLKYRIQENGTFRALTVPPGQTWNLVRQWYKK